MTSSRWRDEREAQRHVEALRWPNGVWCPLCLGGEKVSALGGASMGPGWYHCEVCRRNFTVRTGTVFQWSHVSWGMWLRVIEAFVREREPNLRALHRETGMSYKTVHRMADLIDPERIKPWRKIKRGGPKARPAQANPLAPSATRPNC
jgi:transposase-like protein